MKKSARVTEKLVSPGLPGLQVATRLVANKSFYWGQPVNGSSGVPPMGEDQHFLPHSLYSPHLSLSVFLSGLSHYHLLGSHRVVREKTVVPSDRGGQIYQNILCKIEHLVHVSSRAIDAFLLWFDYPIFLAPLPPQISSLPCFFFLPEFDSENFVEWHFRRW